MGQSADLSQATLQALLVIMVVFMTLFYLVIPGILVLYYQSKHVKHTCELTNPKYCWVDKRPLPILAFSLFSAFAAISLPFSSVYGWVVPFFGILLNGASGATAVLLSALIWLLIANGFYRLKASAWWLAMTYTILWCISSALTFSRINTLEMYEKMNLPEQQIEMMGHNATHQPIMLAPILAFTILTLGCLLYTKKFFVKRVA